MPGIERGGTRRGRRAGGVPGLLSTAFELLDQLA